MSVNLTVGLSHPVDYKLARRCDRRDSYADRSGCQRYRQAGSWAGGGEIRSFRPPEPYKGKGIRYADEVVRRKEAKKK